MMIYVNFFLDLENEEGPLLKEWVLMLGFNFYARSTYYSSEFKCVKECENSAKQLFSKYWVVFPERINDYIDKHFLQSLFLWI